jgi:predicted lipase
MSPSAFVTRLFAVLCLVVSIFGESFNVTSGAYDGTQAQKSLWLSAAASCGHENYKSHSFKGVTSGFVVTKTIFDASKDTQGYVGYLPSDKSIYVVFRGSESTRNWISNLDAFKIAYTTFPECNCQVHKGFYEAEQRVIADVISEVKSLQKLHPTFVVKVTGHSLGAALAQLTSMDLIKAGIATSVYNFGQPRTGDEKYAAFANSKVSTWRVTHNKDMVPHLPFTEKMEFHHVCREQFENEAGTLKTCDTSCEDPTCADQFDFKVTNFDDHVVYLGMSVSCEAVSAV